MRARRRFSSTTICSTRTDRSTSKASTIRRWTVAQSICADDRRESAEEDHVSNRAHCGGRQRQSFLCSWELTGMNTTMRITPAGRRSRISGSRRRSGQHAVCGYCHAALTTRTLRVRLEAETRGCSRLRYGFSSSPTASRLQYRTIVGNDIIGSSPGTLRLVRYGNKLSCIGRSGYNIHKVEYGATKVSQAWLKIPRNLVVACILLLRLYQKMAWSILPSSRYA